MGKWLIDANRKPGILWMELEGMFTQEEMSDFVKAHNAAIEGLKGQDYKVFVNLRQLKPLSGKCTEIIEKAKAYSNAQKNFRGSAVWVSSEFTAVQHRRTSLSGGVMDTELISDDEATLWKHLEQVYRQHPS